MEPTDTTIYKPRNRFNSRVEDWLNRINLLYAQIENWVNDYKNYACIKNRQITMHEQLMKSHHIPAENIDILDVILNEKINISFVPFGLWILGANGRFDVVAEKKPGSSLINPNHLKQYRNGL